MWQSSFWLPHTLDYCQFEKILFKNHKILRKWLCNLYWIQFKKFSKAVYGDITSVCWFFCSWKTSLKVYFFRLLVIIPLNVYSFTNLFHSVILGLSRWQISPQCITKNNHYRNYCNGASNCYWNSLILSKWLWYPSNSNQTASLDWNWRKKVM